MKGRALLCAAAFAAILSAAQPAGAQALKGSGDSFLGDGAVAAPVMPALPGSGFGDIRNEASIVDPAPTTMIGGPNGTMIEFRFETKNGALAAPGRPAVEVSGGAFYSSGEAGTVQPARDAAAPPEAVGAFGGNR